MRADGLVGEALFGAIALFDVDGLLVEPDVELHPWQQDFAWPRSLAEKCGLAQPAQRRSMEAVVRALKPGVVIGACGAPGAFKEGAIRAMARLAERPVLLPLSNPNSRSEAIPSDLISWTGGCALVATGSPFAPLTYKGRIIRVGQVNNAFVFPGVGLGALVSEAREVTDARFTVAAECLSRETCDENMTEHLRTPEPAPLDPAVTVDDRLPRGHRYRQVLAEAIQSRLRDVSGPAHVSLRALGRILVQVDIVAPDGSRWSLGVPVHEGPEADDVAQIVRAGCALHRVEPAQAETRSSPGEDEARSSPATARPRVSSELIPSEGR